MQKFRGHHKGRKVKEQGVDLAENTRQQTTRQLTLAKAKFCLHHWSQVKVRPLTWTYFLVYRLAGRPFHSVELCISSSKKALLKCHLHSILVPILIIAEWTLRRRRRRVFYFFFYPPFSIFLLLLSSCGKVVVLFRILFLTWIWKGLTQFKTCNWLFCSIYYISFVCLGLFLFMVLVTYNDRQKLLIQATLSHEVMM